MRTISQMRQLSKIFMILFLFAFVSARTITILNFSPSPRAVVISQKTSTSSKSDTLIYDEKEKEKEKEEENAEADVQEFSLACFVHGLTLFSLQDKGTDQSYHAPRTCGDATDIPVYLAKRALLI